MIIKKIIAVFLLFCICLLCNGCYELYEVNSNYISEESSHELTILTEDTTEIEIETEEETALLTELKSEPETEEETLTSSIEWGEIYTSKEEVSLYLYTYHELPENYITKNEIKKLGWQGGDLWQYAQGKSIGGDKFYNNEKLLPENNYYECDIDYEGGKRNAKRLVYTEDYETIYYTDDHYQSFTQIY